MDLFTEKANKVIKKLNALKARNPIEAKEEDAEEENEEEQNEKETSK